MAVIHDSPTRFINTGEAAQMLRVSSRTVLRLIHRHELPAVRIGGQYRVDVAALDSHLRTSTTGVR